jgi:membrane associated rhomboid family serine protease
VKRAPFAPIRPAEAVIYMAGAAYLLIKAAYDGFVRHNSVGVAGDIVGIFVGVFLVWFGRFLWKRYLSKKKS